MLKRCHSNSDLPNSYLHENPLGLISGFSPCGCLSACYRETGHALFESMHILQHYMSVNNYYDKACCLKANKSLKNPISNGRNIIQQINMLTQQQ